ncbi:hypothetical protein [Candidatus Pantoea multigeneris]|uniref:Bacteriocin n=1 Tax=Candidatus Pantoea multigeneris TaxID=2608357 RepID=A0ABX0RDN0_9GAMM|nr:hypothetical protein [Pantoea multigeneris]NIF22502.1 hypothetical protein [Pantoea multigeneris]
MKKLNNEEMMMVSGAGNFADKSSGGRVSNDSRGGRGDRRGTMSERVKSCNDGIIGGTLAGSLGGVPGMAVGMVGGAIAGGCFRNESSSSNNNNGKGSGGAQNYGAQCKW